MKSGSNVSFDNSNKEIENPSDTSCRETFLSFECRDKDSLFYATVLCNLKKLVKENFSELNSSTKTPTPKEGEYLLSCSM